MPAMNATSTAVVASTEDPTTRTNILESKCSSTRAATAENTSMPSRTPLGSALGFATAESCATAVGSAGSHIGA